MRVIQDRGPLDWEALVARPLWAHLATASPDGPRDSPVWFLWEAGAFWIIGNRRTDSFPARVDADPRVALGIASMDLATGRIAHVGVRGLARVEAWDADRARRLLRRYLGPDEDQWDGRFRDALHDAHAVSVRVEPVTLVARDQSFTPSARLTE